MMGKVMAVAIIVMMAAVGAEVGFAHHGWSGYDSGQVLNLTGVSPFAQPLAKGALIILAVWIVGRGQRSS